MAHRPAAIGPCFLHKYHERVVEVIAGAEVEQPAAVAGNRRLTRQVTLIADRLAAGRVEIGRVHDAAVVAGFAGGQLLHRFHMPPTRAVAPLTADARLKEDRLLVAGGIFGIDLNLPGVAVEAAITDRPLKTQRWILVVTR